jgi:hypothetical protein
MRYLKTFESFGVNETLGDMMTMPVDITGPNVARAYQELYDDAKSFLKNKFEGFVDAVDSATDAVIDEVPGNKILDNIKKFFGKDPAKLTEDDIKSALSKRINESFVDRYDAADPYTTTKDEDEHMHTPVGEVKGGVVQKIGSILQTILGINILTFGVLGSFLAALIGVGFVSFAMSMIISLVAFIVIHIIKKIFGRFKTLSYICI